MLELIEEAPRHVLAFKAVGEVGVADFKETLWPALGATLAAGRKLRVVYVLGPDFDGYAAGAAWDDMTGGFAQLGHWERCAVVTDREWVEHLAKGFAWLMGPHVRLFPLDELPVAMQWAAARR